MVSGGFGGFWGFRPSQNCFYKIKYFFITLKKNIFNLIFHLEKPNPTLHHHIFIKKE